VSTYLPIVKLKNNSNSPRLNDMVSQPNGQDMLISGVKFRLAEFRFVFLSIMLITISH